MEKRKILTPYYSVRIMEIGGSGAILGAIVFTIIAGFITDAQPTFLMRYSPLIGGLLGGVISFFVAVLEDFKRIKKFREKIPSLHGKQKTEFLEENINSHIYPLQLQAIVELERMANPDASRILREAARKEDNFIRKEIQRVLEEKMREQKV